MAAPNGSMKMANNDGESGRPCLVPLCKVKRCHIDVVVVVDIDIDVGGDCGCW